MRKGLPIILLVLIAMVYQSCDSTLNIDKPKDYYKYIGEDGNQTAVDMVVDGDGNVYILGTTTLNTATLGLQLYLVKTNHVAK
ncbi:MAG: SBBP repeat-containing protein [Bacteroidota bacterium]